MGPAGFELATIPASRGWYRCLRFDRMSRLLWSVPLTELPT